MIVCDWCSDVVEGKVSKAKLELTVSKIRNYKPLEMDLCEKCIEGLMMYLNDLCDAPKSSEFVKHAKAVQERRSNEYSKQ